MLTDVGNDSGAAIHSSAIQVSCYTHTAADFQRLLCDVSTLYVHV